MKLKAFLVLNFLLGSVSCSLFSFNNKSKKQKQVLAKPRFFKKQPSGALRGPCVNLPFLDQHYPEYLNELVRLHTPKVDIRGAYKISVLFAKSKKPDHVVDRTSGKLCKRGSQLGYFFVLRKL